MMGAVGVVVALGSMSGISGCANQAGHPHDHLQDHGHDHALESHDAVIAAGNHHHVKLENERVRVLETVIKPGETVPLHTHCWPSVQYFVEISDLVVRDAKGAVLTDTRTSASKRKPGDILWGQPRELHTVENVGNVTARVISVEIKDGDASR